jgi:ribosomal-protein-alanine N-acetyltransferase
MTLADVPTVGEMELLCFSAPWSPDTYRNELLHNSYGYYWILAPAPVGGQMSAGGQAPAGGPAPTGGPVHTGGPALPPILAYGGYWLMGDEVHIVTLATHPRFRRRGLSERLLLQMVEQCAAQGAALVTLEVRVSNEAARQLYAKLGFVEVGLRRAYYHDNGEDALLMTLFLKPEDGGAL